VEGKTVTGLALGENFPVVRVDNFAGVKKFNADFFGAGAAGVKRIKNFFQTVFVETVAVVAHGEAHAIFSGDEVRNFFRNVGEIERKGDFAPAFVEVVPAMQA
jgi:hypothetical protein